MNDRVLVAILLVNYLDLVVKEHETDEEHDPENIRGCSHARCMAAMRLVDRVKRALRVETIDDLERLADG